MRIFILAIVATGILGLVHGKYMYLKNQAIVASYYILVRHCLVGFYVI